MEKMISLVFNNAQRVKFLTAAVLSMLLAGIAQPVWANSAEVFDGTDHGKLAEVHDGDYYKFVYGASDYDSDVNDDVIGGKINMYGGKAEYLYGGKSWTKDAHNLTSANENIVSISGGIVQRIINGGQAQGYGAEASGNIVNVNGGEIAPPGSSDYFIYAVAGGYAQTYGQNNSAVAYENRVVITGGTLNASVVGGFVSGNSTNNGNSGAANNNIVVIGGDAKIFGNIYGAMSDFKFENDIAEMNKNIIIITGNADISNARLIGIGASAYNNGKFTGTGNTLVIDGWDGDVKSVGGFNNIVFNNVVWQDNGTVVNITGAADTDLNNASIDAGHIHFTDGSAIDANDKMTLIHISSDAQELEDKNVISGDYTAGVAVEGDGQAYIENGDLVYKINDVHTAEQTKLVAENRAVAAAFINQGTDLISDSLDVLGRDGGYGVKTFAAVQGNRSKYDVNSDLKINGWSTIAGVGSETEHNGGDFAWGVFYENGSGNYRTYNSFNNEFFRGDGSLVYNGGGVAARYENAHGVYTEASLRAGMLKSEMKNALRDSSGAGYGYESESAYYGAHIGIGQIIPLGGDSTLDVYGKFFHTYTEGDSFNVSGDSFEFDGINSDRLRIGARINTNKENKFSAYYGLAYEYEFNGEAKMRAAGIEAPEQSLQGSNYMAELGLNYQPSPDSPWNFDLNVRGYAGEREGTTFNVQAVYTF